MRPVRSLALLLLALVAVAAAAQERPRNVVLFIGDGFGPAYAGLARGVAGAPLALDAVLVGSAQTASTDSHVTDSAAGATAYACALRTYNGAIAVDTTAAPCRTILEAAEARGLATGLVATSRITHATPAAFAAHVPDRDLEAEIAAQEAASGVDVLFGGGRRFFLPADTDGSARTDGRDLLRELAARGYHVATDRAGWDALTAAPAAALLAPDHLAYDIDRAETDQPSLEAMTRRALDLLAASPDGAARGFFLMVEGSRIDHAGHDNDPATAAREVLAYDAAVAAALAWARADGRTLVVGVADHETGGLALGRDGVYDWRPSVLAAVTASTAVMAARVAAHQSPARVLADAAGIDALTAEEYALLADAAEGQAGLNVKGALGRILSERALVGWTTGGHTAVDVSVYAFGPGSRAFAGSRTHAAVGRLLFDALGLTPGE